MTPGAATTFSWVSDTLPDNSPKNRVPPPSSTGATCRITSSSRPARSAADGVNATSAGIVCWDRWTQDNHNSVILGRSGAGKSYLAKLDILPSLYQHVQVAVIDPEDEYARLAEAAGGSIIRPGAAGVHLSPLTLPAGAAGPRPDGLTRRAVFGHTFIAVLLGETLTAAERAALDTAIMAACHDRGITADPRTHARPAPLLAAAALGRIAASTAQG